MIVKVDPKDYVELCEIIDYANDQAHKTGNDEMIDAIAKIKLVQA